VWDDLQTTRSNLISLLSPVETHHQPIGATGHFLKVIGETTEAVVIGEKPTNLKFLVVSNCPHPILIGWDSLKTICNNTGLIHFNLDNHTCTIGWITFPLLKNQEIGILEKWKIEKRRKTSNNVYLIPRYVFLPTPTVNRTIAQFLQGERNITNLHTDNRDSIIPYCIVII